MDKSSIRIAIVDDDPTALKSLAQAVKKMGFDTLEFRQSEDAISTARLQNISAYIIDCLLPITSGIQLALSLRKNGYEDTPIILISGVYKDKAFINESLKNTKAIKFLTKPINLEELEAQLQKSLDHLIDDPLEPLDEVMVNPLLTPFEKLKAVKATTIIHGYELPRVISLLMVNGISGTLTLRDSQGKKSEIDFKDAKILRTALDDQESFFGKLLVEKGFLDPLELEEELLTSDETRIGEHLINANLISPHVIPIINAEQMAIRLSKLIANTRYKMQFNEKKLPDSEWGIERNIFYTFCSNWLYSKISATWLKNFYMLWADNTIIKSSKYEQTHTVYFLRPLKDMQKDCHDIPGKTFESLLSEKKVKEEDMCRGLYLMQLAGQVVFDRSHKRTHMQLELQKLKRINEEIKEQNHFEILGLSKNSKSSEIKKSYHDLAKNFHPDKISSSDPQEMKKLKCNIFARMTEAYKTLSTEQLKAEYLKKISQGDAEKILRSKTLLEEGKILLKKNQNQRALQLFEEAISLTKPTAELVLHALWAKLAKMNKSNDKASDLSEIEKGLNNIAPENRHTAIYYFVKGLFQKYIGQTNLAKRNLEHCLALQRNHIEAQRELHMMNISKHSSKNIDIFNDDLSQVFSAIFKRKKEET